MPTPRRGGCCVGPGYHMGRLADPRLLVEFRTDRYSGPIEKTQTLMEYFFFGTELQNLNTCILCGNDFETLWLQALFSGTQALFG